MTSPTRDTSRLKADSIITESALAQFSALLDASFPVEPGNHYFDDFPVWDPKNEARGILRLGVFEDDKLLSCCGVRLVDFKASRDNDEQGGESDDNNRSNSTVKLALIGAVATHPEWRTLGLASGVVGLAAQWAKERGAVCAILWGSEYKLYQNLGFGLCGQQGRVSLRRLIDARPTPIHAFNITVHQGWNPNLFPLLQQRKKGMVLTPEDRRWYEAHKNVLWFYTGTRNHPTAYAAMGRGIDLANIVHEWGGSMESLHHIFKSVVQTNPGASIIGSAKDLEKLGVMVDPDSLEFLCMAKPLDPAGFFTAFNPEIPARAEQVTGGWNIALGLRSFRSISDGELMKQLMGPSDSRTGEIVPMLPLPLWIWGLDAV